MNSLQHDVRGNILLDIDDAMIPNTNMNGVTPPIVQLKKLLHRLEKSNYRIVLVTGQPISVVEQVRQVIEMHAWACTEHGALFYPNGNRHDMVNEETLQHYNPLRNRAIGMVTERGGSLDPSEVIVVGQMPHGTLRSTYEILADDNVDHNCTPHDRRITILPKGTTKGNILKQLSEPVLVAAGDSGSDLPILKASEFPIVTVQAGKAANANLAEIVSEKQKGYVANENQPDGKGLYIGLMHAIAEGILNLR